ncbi:MAG: serine/threonine-protein phosphatase [Phycisphaeraceae bacterium]|nr:serine/threonine-protein phosphatase [Phycisphaeraceae bacterium]
MPAVPIPPPTYRPSDLPGVSLADLRANERLPLLLKLTHKLFNQTEDHGIINEFAEAMGRIRGRSCMVMVRTRDCPPGSYRITRWRTADGDELVTPIMHDGQVNTAPIRSGGLIGHITTEELPQMARLDGSPDSVMGDWTRGYRSLVSTPLPEKSQPADWLILLDTPEDRWTMEQLETVVLQANLVGVVIRNLNIARRLKEATSYIQNEIDQIAEIQRSLLPQTFPEIAGLEIAASYATFDRAGGDYYDVFPDPNGSGRFGFLIADASGHGPSAAVVVAMLHAVVANFSRLPEPSEVLEEINRKLFARRIGNSFVTALVAVYDPAEGTLRFAGAGHPPPILKRANSAHEIEFEGGPPLGILERVDSAQGSITLKPGDTVLLYTDGISEAMSIDHKLFGVERIRGALVAAAPGAQQTIDRLNAALKDYIGAAKPNDDQTMLTIRRFG